ncbi:MAG: methyltransferase [Aquihabitans sp.]
MPSTQPDHGDHYFSSKPSGASDRRTIDLVLPEGRLLPLLTDRGVFSADQVDPGTRILLAEPFDFEGATTLVDLGCGYGPVAIALALRSNPDTVVWAVDVNERARDLCRANAEANGMGDRIRVVAPDEFPADLAIDQIWSNPPIRVGKAALHDLLETWLNRLDPTKGSATMVVNKNLGSDSLARWLDQGGWPTERLTSRAGYRILRSTVAPPTAAPESNSPAGEAGT